MGFGSATITAVIGVASGVAGAILAGRFITQPREAQAEARPERDTPGPPQLRVPLGWNLNLAERVSALEQAASTRQSGEGARPSDDKLSKGSHDDMLGQREQERAAHYQEELKYRSRILAEHESEPYDPAWSAPQSDAIRQSVGAAAGKEGSAQLQRVDCRSKTCTATLQFEKPKDALTYVQQRPVGFEVPGCNGWSAIPTPPDGDGRYDLTVVFSCR